MRMRILLIVICLCRPIYSGCIEILDTIEVEEAETVRNGTDDGSGDGGISEELTGHKVHTIILAGLGAGYFDNPGYKTFTFTFFLANLWEVWKYGAIRAAGEVYIASGDALSGDISAGFNVYPFQYGTTPYMGIETGYGYGQVEGESDYGFNISGEIGVFAIKVSKALLAASVRISLMQSTLSGEYPLGYSIRFGILL
ncbi:MAG: hypothetical protein JW915_16730 [Chitinispirillaceae bacterium]|nr:hypothetical protein [Chitinispirillaceae bacterium]